MIQLTLLGQSRVNCINWLSIGEGRQKTRKKSTGLIGRNYVLQRGVVGWVFGISKILI